jgi:hypothetical protein
MKLLTIHAKEWEVTPLNPYSAGFELRTSVEGTVNAVITVLTDPNAKGWEVHNPALLIKQLIQYPINLWTAIVEN